MLYHQPIPYYIEILSNYGFELKSKLTSIDRILLIAGTRYVTIDIKGNKIVGIKIEFNYSSSIIESNVETKLYTIGESKKRTPTNDSIDFKEIHYIETYIEGLYLRYEEKRIQLIRKGINVPDEITEYGMDGKEVMEYKDGRGNYWDKEMCLENPFPTIEDNVMGILNTVMGDWYMNWIGEPHNAQIVIKSSLGVESD
jgi:hypothetical protein